MKNFREKIESLVIGLVVMSFTVWAMSPELSKIFGF